MYRQHQSRAVKTRKRLKVTQNLVSQCNVCVAIVSKIMYNNYGNLVTYKNN